MNQTKLIYVFDAICGWCFGFSPTIAKIQAHYQGRINIEVVSGGLMLGPRAGTINAIAPFIRTVYLDIEATCGVKFGAAFINGGLKDGEMVLNSLPPAIALCIFKERFPRQALMFTRLLHQMIYIDGIGPERLDAYGGYAARLGYDADEFNRKMTDKIYLQKANEDFAYARALGAHGFPTLILQHDGKKERLFSGYMPFERVTALIDARLHS